MTTLFNLFCPYILLFSMLLSVSAMICLSLVFIVFLLWVWLETMVGSLTFMIVSAIFPLSGTFSFSVVTICFSLASLNLLSMVVYSFPVTTSLSFNFSLAFSFWLSGILVQNISHLNTSAVLPSNSPWYLVPFLAIVELISVLVRPVTLCFRLLANMSAGHILLTLICKMPFGLWCLGTLFGLLELMVAVVQSFVFLMLIGVYLEEAMTH